MPDDNEIIIWAKGKIKRVNIENKKAMDIPFTVKRQTSAHGNSAI
jgi:hypothetical protein